MPRYRVEWTEIALERLDEIHKYILTESQSGAVADKFRLKLIDKTQILETFPFTGQEEGLLASRGLEARYLVEGNYKLIYRIDSNKVMIMDIFHTKQNPEKLISRNKP